MTDQPSSHPLRNVLAGFVLAALFGCASQPSEPDREAEPAEPAGEQQEQQAEAPGETRVTREDVKPSHPVRYTVRKGDTLWDIASMFLRDPWVWPEIWAVNPAIENPHLIYPGDTITLMYAGDEPRLVVERPSTGATGDDYVKLEPQVREQPIGDAVPAIPADAIRQFLNRPRVVTQAEIDDAPYIVGNYEGRLISGAGNDVFARGFPDGGPDAERYNVYRPGDALRDPVTNEILGYEAIYTGKAALRATGDPARLHLTQSTREILRGDRLMSADRQMTRSQYFPQVPDQRVEAQIIKLFDAISQVGTNQVVVLNYGTRDGAAVSQVLEIMQSGGTVSDPYASGEDGEERVELPPQRVGALMIFRAFDRVSYALILEAEQAIQRFDTVKTP